MRTPGATAKQYFAPSRTPDLTRLARISDLHPYSELRWPAQHRLAHSDSVEGLTPGDQANTIPHCMVCMLGVRESRSNEVCRGYSGAGSKFSLKRRVELIFWEAKVHNDYEE